MQGLFPPKATQAPLDEEKAGTHTVPLQTCSSSKEQRTGFDRCRGKQATGHVWAKRYDWPEAYFADCPVSAPVLESASRHLTRCQRRLGGTG